MLNQVIHGITFDNVMLLNFLLLDVNFEKSNVGLHFLLISSMFAKFQNHQRSIIILSIKCLNFNFLRENFKKKIVS